MIWILLKGAYIDRDSICASIFIWFLGMPENWSHKEVAGGMVVMQKQI